MVKAQLMVHLAAFNNKVGKPAKVEEVLENVKPWNPRFKPVKNRYGSEFLLFAVPNDIAAAADCAEQNAVEPSAGKEESPPRSMGIISARRSASRLGTVRAVPSISCGTRKAITGRSLH